MKGFRTLTKRLKLDLGWKRSRRGDFSEMRVYGAREKCFLLSEKWKSEVWIVPQLYIENTARWTKVFCRDLSSTKSWQKWNCWGAVEICQQQNSPRWIENQSQSYRADRKIRNMAWWIEEAIENLSRRNPEISMDQEFVEIYWEKRKKTE